MTGIGEQLEYLSPTPELLRRLNFLLVLLPIPTETRAVFARYRASGVAFSPSSKVLTAGDLLDETSLRSYLHDAKNDLEEAAGVETPLIRDVLRQLRRFPSLYAGLSGSGSTCFAVFDDAKRREECVKGF